MKGYGSYHPAVLFLYYILAIGFSMFSMHPVVAAASVCGGFLLFLAGNGIKKTIGEFGFFLCLFVMMALANPMVVHSGETILFFMNDNPVTLEAIVYGCVSALMLTGVLVWCKCYSAILTTDKFLYLFGKTIPKLGLILSMVFRFIPLFKLQIRKINQSQKTMGLYATTSIPDRAGGSLRVFDSLLSWSMENSIDTADAMKARGYGLHGRTCFTLFRFRKRDGILLGVMGGLALLVGICFYKGAFDFYYYPYVAEIQHGGWSILGYGSVLVFMCIPGVLELKEKLSWNYLKSKI